MVFCISLTKECIINSDYIPSNDWKIKMTRKGCGSGNCTL